MRPEEIDKLFNDRLGKAAPAPPADLWNRLQARMEEEMPQQQPKVLPMDEPKAGKQRFLWMYSSIAATLSLLLTVGIVFYNIKTNAPELRDVVVKNETRQLEERPVIVEPLETKATEIAQAEEKNEKVFDAGATEVKRSASKVTERVTKAKAIANVTEKNTMKRSAEKATGIKHKTHKASSVASSKTTAQPVSVTPEVQPEAPAILASTGTKAANLNAEPVEIVIKRAIASQPAQPVATEEQGIEKKARLAKNIFKQVRNLSNGEPVELADLGINANKIALGTQIGKQKFSKVINL
ncbi:hypothetical protein [Pontibacter vulgaris]|uniref:hypothetical protein n=1 Tax=Pontibacter vulgaris TaxID=2905679 RepID=UPI001FA6AB08|nr:hypothetical protein [Pontibacter vulgaris]